MEDDSPRDRSGFAYWIRFLIPIPFILVISIFSQLPPLIFLSEEALYIAAIPVAEELFKLIIRMKFQNESFWIIFSFGIIELILVNASVIFGASSNRELLLFTIWALIPLNFHVATAFAYTGRIFEMSPAVCFGFCLFAHAIFNALDFIMADDRMYILALILTSLSPLVLLIKLRQFRFTIKM